LRPALLAVAPANENTVAGLMNGGEKLAIAVLAILRHMSVVRTSETDVTAGKV
jgi:hypothetical protein